MLSRRKFLGVAGSAALASRLSLAAPQEVPRTLDHILLGCNDLNQGIAYVEERTGVRAMIGGVHPGAGTRNALLSLGVRQYLEIIAPDPNQKGVSSPRLSSLQQLKAPIFITWAAHVDKIEDLAKVLREERIKFDGPRPGSRKRPDGRMLSWKTLGLEDEHRGVLPFFIEWSADSVHPSVDASKGCRLEDFRLGDPDPNALLAITKKLQLDVEVARASRPELLVKIAGPKGILESA